jgi:FAD/FMN-containing dehydrogenase
MVNQLVRELRQIVGEGGVITDPDMLVRHSTDWTGRFTGQAKAVVRPSSTSEVAEIVMLCRQHSAAIVPQGGNTGMVGGSVPVDEIVLSTARMSGIEPVDCDAQQVTVGAGATLAMVRAHANASRLAYTVDIGSRDTATIGGTIATNAGGLNLLRYGGTREQVVGLEAVLGTGGVVSHLGGLVKDNTGYHLPALLCGSEGTLGVITRARLRLMPFHAHRVAALVGFASTADAVESVTAWRAALDVIDAVELMLEPGMRLVCETFGLRRPFAEPAAAYVLVEVAAHADPTELLASAVSATPTVGDIAVAVDGGQRAALWRYREDHPLAINQLGVPHKLDVTLPASRLVEFLETVGPLVQSIEPAARTWLFGHVGDGNIHVNVTGLPPEDEGVDDIVLNLVSEMSGSISAEHGVGVAKKRWLHLSRSVAEIDAMRAIKHALDPDNILNPRVLF